MRKVDRLLVAVQELGGEHSPVCIFELTVRVWEMDKAAFGLHGYRTSYPDHKAVYALLQSLLSRVVNKCYLTARCLERPKPNTVKLTQVGIERLKQLQVGKVERAKQLDVGYIG